MKVLLDVGISPRLRLPLQSALGNTPVESAVFHQWRTLRDDELLAQASLNGFTTLVTTDKHLATEQRQPYVAVVAVDDNRLTALRGALTEIAQAIRSTAPGEHRIVNTLELTRFRGRFTAWHSSGLLVAPLEVDR